MANWELYFVFINFSLLCISVAVCIVYILESAWEVIDYLWK